MTPEFGRDHFTGFPMVTIPDFINQLLKNGKTPEADYMPVVLLELKPEGAINMAFRLMRLWARKAVYVYDLFAGSGAFEDKPYMLHLDANQDFQAKHLISVYDQASEVLPKSVPLKD
jgi:hypothetical protein